jgi:hypothetical protein
MISKIQAIEPNFIMPLAATERRALIDAWAIFCAASKESTVVPLKRRKAE